MAAICGCSSERGHQIAGSGHFAPNAEFELKATEDFATGPFYKLVREEALYGGAIALDVPSTFFVWGSKPGGGGAGYQELVEQEIRWANRAGLRTTMLLSPYPWPAGKTARKLARNTFRQDTEIFVKQLADASAVPSEWVVENYADTNPTDAPAVGPDTLPNSVSEVALWVASHAPVYTTL